MTKSPTSTGLVLGIDTSDRGAHAAVASADGVQGAASSSGRDAVEQLARLIRGALDDAGCELKDIFCIAAAAGPGSYTGIRGGIACAQGLSMGLAVPAYGVSTLLAHAMLAGELPKAAVLSMPAAKKEVFWTAVCREAGRLRPLCGIRVCAEEQLAAQAGEVAAEHLSVGELEHVRLGSPGQRCLARGCARAIAEQRIAASPGESFGHLQQSADGRGLLPSYGKGVAAKTLVERGLPAR